MRRHSGWIWGGRIVAVAVVAGLISYLSIVGLDKADKLASVLGLFVAVAALAAPYLLPPAQDPAAQPAPAPAAEPPQSVVNAVVMGRLTQAKGVGSLQVPAAPPSGAAQAAAPPAAAPPAAAPPGAAPPAAAPGAVPPVTGPAAAAVPGSPGGQYVNGVWVGGDLTQIDGTDGDVTLG